MLISTHMAGISKPSFAAMMTRNLGGRCDKRNREREESEEDEGLHIASLPRQARISKRPSQLLVYRMDELLHSIGLADESKRDSTRADGLARLSDKGLASGLG